MFDLQPPRHISNFSLSGGSQGGEFTSAFGEQRKCLDGRPRVPSTRNQFRHSARPLPTQLVPDVGRQVAGI